MEDKKKIKDFDNASASGSSEGEENVKVVRDEKLSIKRLWKAYPKHVGFIVSNEFCERFSYYGMRSVLLLYLRNYLLFDDDTSTSIYHAFTVFVYFFPLVGAIVADSYWGKYKTIILLSIVYVLGHVIKTIGSIPYIPTRTAHIILSMTGLLFIAAGTGGIKPCVSSFGGDQFTPDQSYVRKQFFSLFYFAINAGSLISTFLTPVFRADVDCYPNETAPEFDECFALAFGVPGALMVIALVLFAAGTKWYTIYPPEGSVFLKLCKCIYTACKNRWNTPTSERNKEHWLEYADSPAKMIRDTKYVLRILVLFIPLPMFWALFDQQGSRWTLQAIQLNGYLGDLLLKPDQIEVINPLLIVTLIPLLELTLYPCLRHFDINFPPLRRMTVGLVLAGLSFVAAAILQLEIDKTLTVLPKSSEYGVRLINVAPCNLTVMNGDTILGKKSATAIQFFPVNAIASFNMTSCDGSQQTFVATGATDEVKDIFIHNSDATALARYDMVTHKSEDGGGRFTIINLAESQRTFRVQISPEQGEPSVAEQILVWEARLDVVDVARGKTTLYVMEESRSNISTEIVLYNVTFDVDVGGVYSAVLGDTADTSFTILDLKPNTVNVGWIIPQFFIITLGEVFLSITGLEFSYTQAPPSMKSVLQAMWLFTVAVGNIIVLIVAEAKLIEKQSDEFILFACLIFVAAFLFVILAYRYIPVDEREFAKEIEEEDLRLKRKARMYTKKKQVEDTGIEFNNESFSEDDNEANKNKSPVEWAIQTEM